MSDISRKRGLALIAGALCLLALSVGLISCTGAPTADPINGVGGGGNTPPTLTITEPVAATNVAQGAPFLIRWTDSDSDDNASISFDLVDSNTNAEVAIVADLAENDQIGPDSFTVPTSLIPISSYYLRGTIDDGINAPVEVFATVGETTERLVITIREEGTGGQEEPPRITITEPQFDLSVTQDDVVTVVVAPTPPPQGTGIFDRDSEFQLWVLLDLDLNPGNDDPANEDPNEIIILASQTVPANTTTLNPFAIPIDLTRVPPRPNGEPYFIRATADDSLNPRVHSYAAGTLNVVRQVAGVVDLSLMGKTLSGARWYGFNPGGNLGSDMAGVSDFDQDGVDDMAFISQFGNPRNAGQVGEGYLIYGLNGSRFGGTVAINSVSETVAGVVFEAPPVRFDFLFGEGAETQGITDVSFLPDMNGDLRPELIFGLPHVIHAFDTMDYDPADEDIDVTSDTNQIEIELTQGRECFTLDNEDPVQLTYTGVVDTYISTGAPNTAFGGADELAWQNEEGGTRKWTLIKFVDILEVIPAEDLAFINIDTVEADIEMRLFDPGAGGTVHQCLTDFDEDTTYANFAENGGDPEPEVDYVIEPGGGDGALDTVDAEAVGTITVQVDEVLQRLIDGLLTESDNELRFIIVPDALEADDEARTRSTAYGSLDECPFLVDRPVLRIQYTRRTFGPAGCYPDLLVNNLSDSDQVDPDDVQWYSGGMAVIVNSTNRDNDGVVDANRLASTAISLELTGQEPGWVLDPDGTSDTGTIFARADTGNTANLGTDPAEDTRIAGVRIVPGGYEWEFFGPLQGGLFGQSVSWLGDVNNDGLQEIVISAPTNERFLADLGDEDFTTFFTTPFDGSLIVIPGGNYNQTNQRDTGTEDGTSQTPFLDHGHAHPPAPGCNPPRPRHVDTPVDTFQVYAEGLDDMLGGAGSAGDFNQDGLDDLLAGAYQNDRSSSLQDTGAAYVLYSRTVLADFDLTEADDPLQRPPMLRIRGVKPGDQIGWRQTSGRDVNGDRIDDIFISSPRTDFGGVTHETCAGDFDDDGNVDQDDLRFTTFELCQQQFGNDLFFLDDCKVFDYDNDGDIDEDDRCVFCCLSNDCTPANSCTFGKTSGQCCQNVEENGFVGVIFGGRFLDGDRDITQLATSDLPGAIFYGGHAGDRAGMDIASAGDFNQDGFGDLLIAVPGETRVDSANRTRVGVVYLIFGGTHLNNTTWNLSDPIRGVGTEELPGIVFFSPYVAGRPNEAAPLSVAGLGDINNDGFDDVAIGNPKADFIDLTFPQGPDAPGSDAAAGRRRDAGDVYIVYGNNFGSNRGAP